MANYGWLLDFKRCIECRACEAACKQWNGVETGVGVRYRVVHTSETGKYPNVKTEALSLACNHCDNAYCVKVCPTKAITRRDDGIVLINKDRCIGCRLCEDFCPYGAPQFNAKTNKMEKCTMCVDRVGQDLQPACATLCPTGALQWGSWEDIHDQGIGQVPGFTDPKYTQPNIRFVIDPWRDK